MEAKGLTVAFHSIQRSLTHRPLDVRPNLFSGD